MLASNTPIWADPRGSGLEARGFTDEAWSGRVKTHTDLLDSHSIEAQLVGPRPFTMLGWMQPHIMEAWSRFTNHMIAKQCEMEPTRYVGAAMLPQEGEFELTMGCPNNGLTVAVRGPRSRTPLLPMPAATGRMGGGDGHDNVMSTLR